MIDRMRIRSLSIALAWACSIIFVAIHILDWIHLINWETSVAWLGVSRFGLIQQHLFYQLFTAPFVHASVTHLAFNMLTLCMLGPDVERALGRAQFLVLCCACAITSELGFLLLSSSRGAMLVGFSGIIFGILVVQAVIKPNTTLVIFAVFPMRMKYAVLLLGGMELCFTLEGTQSGTAHLAHVFGALTGGFWMVGLRLQRQQGVKTNRQRGIPTPRRNRNDIPREL